MTRRQEGSLPVGKPVTASGFGTLIRGFDLGAADDEALAALRRRWLASGGLLILRGAESVCPRDFLRFCEAFGALEKNEKYDPDYLLPGYPEILRLGNLRRGGRYRSLFVRADRGARIQWHTDDSFRCPQPAGSIFLCRVHPEEGGGTWYAGMAHAAAALPRELRRRTAGRHAVHSYSFLDTELRKTNPHRRPLSREVRRRHPPVVRPLLSHHPETGREVLCIPDCHIAAVSGLSPDATRELLRDLVAYATQPQFSVNWAWQPGDVAVWDNRSAMHAGSPFDETEARLLYRVTFAGPDSLLQDPPTRFQSWRQRLSCGGSGGASGTRSLAHGRRRVRSLGRGSLPDRGGSGRRPTPSDRRGPAPHPPHPRRRA